MSKRTCAKYALLAMLVCVMANGCVMPNEIQESRDVNVEVVA